MSERVDKQHTDLLSAFREWTIFSEIRAIEPLVSEVVELCVAAGFSGSACRLNIPVALTEALANAIMRGNGSDVSRRVYVSAALDRHMLTVEVTDEGAGFDASTVTFSPDDEDWLEREDGRGLFLMRSLMDKVELERSGFGAHGQTVRLVLHRP